MAGHFLDFFLEGSIPQVTVGETLEDDDFLIDVRTADEFSAGSIPGALNYPLFDRTEHSLIGTLYRQEGADSAMECGKNLISPRLERFIKDLNPLRSRQLTIYCARGGMRSSALTRFFHRIGFQVRQLEGGYKAYRNYVLEQLQRIHAHLIVLHGQTGVGKTLLIQRLPLSIDLEDLAQHRSSVFGAINREPRTQKNFEGLLHEAVRKLPRDQYLFIEGESRKVGPVYIPETLACSMKIGRKVLLTASLDTRVRRILSEYPVKDPETLSKVGATVKTLKQQLGKKLVNHLCNCLKQGEFKEFVTILLEEYYDPKYQYGMRNYRYDLELDAEDLDQVQAGLVEFRNQQKNVRQDHPLVE